MKLISYVILLLLYGACKARESPIANCYMDTLAATVTRKYGHESVRIPDFSIGQAHQLGLKIMDINIQYFNSIMTGLYQIKRLGNCSHISRNLDIISFSCDQSFPNLRFHYFGRISYENVILDDHFKIRLDLKPLYGKTEFLTNIHTDIPTIKNYYLSSKENIQQTIHGLGSIKKPFAKLVVRDLAKKSVEFFLETLKTKYMIDYKDMSRRIPVISTSFGKAVFTEKY